ncbi:lipase [Colwellia sp. 4_MG-2023]|uniref:VolA/Pla-1 family phospholipase n=1 Tax=unclassified Colwellia TaxID=196834 RepID=UPI001C08B267|nr:MULTISPECIES: VolA/Pla-1 family phospholipase [unclassified Colwellia]MBU2925661.1 lipase [Colwellia sp. C2M11]MDO6487856.1 lipase [Colwellia sp. 6_MG-2023]MDO6507491.1 lipase [Colwellia sp. 5_MG-2023]MDO6556251.1 lipase [Colwellia sp. 4_MG-2023]MDO6651113.1 lipase [Colwellia sp. 3_MG-2023]
MKKLVLSLAIISALGLSGCDSETVEDVKQDAVENGAPIVAPARIVFDPAGGVLSVPNDLLFQGSQDGSLNLPVSDPTDSSDPFFALSTLDGWSTTNPFVLAIDFPEGTSLDSNSAFSAASVKIYETLMGGDTGCEEVPRGAACTVVGELTFGIDFITQASGNSVAVIPLKPFKAKTGYVLALTNNLQDNNGKAISGSTTYESVRQNITTHPLATDAQKGLQAVINSYEAAVVAAGADKDSLIYTMAFTTQSTVDVLSTTKALMANNVPAMVANAMQGVPTIGVQDTGMTVADILVGKIPDTLVPLYSAANFMQGNITLPYYLGIPSAENPMAPINDWWKSLCDSGAMLAGLAVSNPEVIPADATSVSDGTCMAISQAQGLAAPGLRDLGIDTERNLTKYSPVPKANTEMSLVVQMTTPDVNVANAVREGLGLPANLAEPENGWPVVILQHGITSKKEDMLAVTGLLSVYGFSTVAIDHPLHGSRGFDITGPAGTPDGVDDINASTVSATHYMNLASLLTTRDNLRQSTSDLMGLRLGLNFLGGTHTEGNSINIDSSNVHFLGHSLGAITGMNFIALANTSLDPQVDPLFAVQTNSLAMPGIMVANFLMESGAFGDVIKSNLAYSASEAFQGYVAQAHLSETAPSETELVGYYRAFYALLTSEQQAELNGTFTQFAFAAQTVVDAGDPANYAAMMVATDTPTHLIEVVGNGSDNLSDQVIPNTVSTAPFAGTEGAIALLGLPGVSETTQDADSSISGAVRYLFGHHGSILDPTPGSRGEAPDAAMTSAATTEMQSQVANFFSSNGHLISVQNDAVVK